RFSIDAHLDGRDPHVLAMYQHILRLLRALGPLQVRALKTTIALSAPAILGYLTPQTKTLKVTLLLIGENHHPTLRKTFPMSTLKRAHEFSLATESDLDNDFKRLLRDAWQLASESD